MCGRYPQAEAPERELETEAWQRTRTAERSRDRADSNSEGFEADWSALRKPRWAWAEKWAGLWSEEVVSEQRQMEPAREGWSAASRVGLNWTQWSLVADGSAAVFVGR